jgi:hypothetical protein
MSPTTAAVSRKVSMTLLKIFGGWHKTLCTADPFATRLQELVPLPASCTGTVDAVATEPMQQRHNVFHATCLEMGQPRTFVQANPDKPANTPQDMQQTPLDEDFQSNNVLNEMYWAEGLETESQRSLGRQTCLFLFTF